MSDLLLADDKHMFNCCHLFCSMQSTLQSILDVVTLNKQIVLMRYDVRRSKVHLINKLSRQAKLWKNKKGTEKQVQKNQYRAERMIKEISVINQLEDDDVSKFALHTTSKELQEIQSDTKLLLATRAMAKLALYKFVAASVETFQTQHPDWQELLPCLFEKLSKSKKKKQGKDDKISKPVVNNSHRSAISGKENSEGSDTDKLLEIDQFSEGHEIDNKNYAKQRNNNKERIPCSKKIKEDASEDEMNDRHENNVTHSTGSYTHAALNRKIKKENISEEFDTESENKRSDEMKVVDPFFITMENTEYVTTQVPTIVRSENTTDSFQNRNYESDNIRSQDKSTSKVNWKRVKVKNSLFKQSYKHDNVPENNFQLNKHMLNFKVHSGGTIYHKRSAHQSSEHETLKQEKLHPSWEAKKKLSSVAAFEGKKITFDDD